MGFSPYIIRQNSSAFRPRGMLFPFAPAKNRTSGPKGRKILPDYVRAEAPYGPSRAFSIELFRSLFSP